MFHLPFPVYDINASSGDDSLGTLPEWNLDDLYTGQDAPELKRDLDWLESACTSFAGDYEGKLDTLDAAGLLTCIQRQERINQIAGRVMSYAGLRYYQLTTDADRAKFMSDVQEKVTNFTTPLVFFTLELNRLEDDHLSGLLAQNADLARYKPIFDRIRAMKPYQLSDEMEKFLHDLGVVGDAWERLFDETIAGLTFDIDGEALNIEGTLNFLTDPDRKKRETAARELAEVFSSNIKTFARVHNTQAKEKEIMDRWRGMPTAQTGR
ncbi:MAG: oligoendopeptidase F, partial [Pseudomonadota bacterium]